LQRRPEKMATPEILDKCPMLIAGPIVSCRDVGFQNLEALRSHSRAILATVDQRIGKEDQYAIGFASVPKNQSIPLIGCNDGLDHLMLVGVEVPNLNKLPIGVVGMELPRSRYAVFTHRGSPVSMLEETIGPAYKWVRDSTYELNGPYDVEHEGAGFLDRGMNPESKSYFWLPITGNEEG
jgi:hypothetical protein